MATKKTTTIPPGFSLELLGVTREELQDRAVKAICDQVLTDTAIDEDGEPYAIGSRFSRRMNEAVRKHIDKAIEDLAAKHVLPNVSSYVANLSLQETTKWGEKRGEPMSFIDYLVARAENYLVEKVDYQGRTKTEASGYSWSPTQTRIVHLVHQHLHYSIEAAMKQALATVNSAIVTGINEAVKLKLASFAADLKTVVEMKERR